MRLGLTRAALCKSRREAYFLVPLTITARFDPRRIFECPAKLFASAPVQLRPGLTRVALNSAAKLSPFHIGSWLGFTLAIPLCLNRGAFLPNPIRRYRFGFTRAAISELFREVFFSSPPSACQPGFTLAAIPVLTREVFLPDQSAAHTKSTPKCWQE
jgi:hypothetical protein